MKKGDRLFVIDTTQAEAEVARAVAGLAEFKARHSNLLTGKRAEEQEVIRAQRREIEASLVMAEADLARQTDLLAKRITSRQSFDQAAAYQPCFGNFTRGLRAEVSDRRRRQDFGCGTIGESLRTDKLRGSRIEQSDLTFAFQPRPPGRDDSCYQGSRSATCTRRVRIARDSVMACAEDARLT